MERFPAGVNAGVVRLVQNATGRRRERDNEIDAFDVVNSLPVVQPIELLQVDTSRLEPVVNVFGGQVSVTPNEPISPTDCDLWPSSPFCNPLDSVNVQDFAGIEIEVFVGEDEVAIVVQPTLAFLQFPPLTISYSRGEREYPEPVPPPAELDFVDSPLPEQFSGFSPSRCIFITLSGGGNGLIAPTMYVTIGPPKGIRENQFGLKGLMGVHFVDYERALRLGYNEVRFGNSGLTEMTILDVFPLTEWTHARVEQHREFEGLASFLNQRLRQRGAFTWQAFYCAGPRASSPLPPPPPPIIPEDDVNCCRQNHNDLRRLEQCLKEVKEMQEKLIEAMGVNDFPLKHPLLTGDNDSQKNMVELIEWAVKNLDATNGHWPMEVKVLDRESKVKKIKLDDQSEAMHELFGLLFAIAEDADAAVNVASRATVESVQTKVATLQASQWLKTVVDFLGYEIQDTEEQVKISVRPKAQGRDNQLQNQEVADFLKPSTMKYKGVRLTGQARGIEILERILEDVEIARAALYRKLSFGKSGDSNLTGAGIVREALSGLGLADEEFDDFIDGLRKRGIDIDEKPPGFRYD